MPFCRTTQLSTVLPESDDLLALIGQISEGVAAWQADPWQLIYANECFLELTGERADEWAAAPNNRGELTGPTGATLKGLLDQFRNRGVESSTLPWSTSSADCGPIEIRVFRIRPNDNSLVGMIARPNTAEPPQRSGLSSVAHRDPLTGLPDRAFLMERLSTMLAGERIADRQFAVLFLDLDNFKQVNDEFGHLIGDGVLREAARRIAGSLREGDHVVRYGGDEFVALVGGVTDTCQIEPVIARIHMALAAPIALPGGEVTLSLSAGTALGTEAKGSPEELLAAADRAMYAAKRTAV
jgi:diguanylate cyclase (GGDEF)-like protein